MRKAGLRRGWATFVEGRESTEGGDGRVPSIKPNICWPFK